MKRYTIGLLTGILLTASAVMFLGAKNQSKNLGHITVNSITVIDDKIEIAVKYNMAKLENKMMKKFRDKENAIIKEFEKLENN